MLYVDQAEANSWHFSKVYADELSACQGALIALEEIRNDIEDKLKQASSRVCAMRDRLDALWAKEMRGE